MGDGRRFGDDRMADSPDSFDATDAAGKLRADAYGDGAGKSGDKKPLERAAQEENKAEDKPEAEERAERPTEAAETAVETERQRLARLQETLTHLLPAVNPDLLEKMKKEQEKGEFGPATKQAYQESVQWLRANVTDTMASLDKQALPVPPGCPIELPKDKSGLPVIDSYYRSLIATRRLELSINADTSKVPDSSDLDKLANSTSWISDGMQLLSQTSRKFESERLAKIIEQIKRPGWAPPENEKELERWYAAAAPMVDLTMKVRNYAEAISSLHQAGGTFPKDGILPENFPGELKFDSKGKIIDIKIDLPEDLRQTPENIAKIEKLEAWLEKYHGPVDQALEEMVKAAADHNRLLIWEDLPESGKVKLDKDGNVIPDVLRDKTDGKEEKYNLAECRFDVETLPDGRIKVTNSKQYQRSHWYNYLDIGADDIGKEIKGEERIYEPHEFVPVVRGGKIEIMRADNLSSWRTKQMAWHYGEKAATVALDVGMLVTGTIEIGVAYRAARAGELAFRAAIGQALKGSFRVALGGTGFLNNAAIKETSWGNQFLMARGAVMLTDVSLGLGRSALGWIRGAKGLEQAATTASIMDKTLKGANWTVRALDKSSKVGFLFADTVFVPIIGGQILDQVQTIKGEDQKRHLDDAVYQRGGGLGEGGQERAAHSTPAERLAASKDVLAGYSASLEIKDASARARAEALLTSTQESLALPAGDAGRQKHKQDLIDTFRTAQSEEEKLAAAAGLLYAARNEDGSLPDVIGQRRYTIPAQQGSDGKEIPAREVTEDIKAIDVVSFLETQVASSRPGGSRLVAGDLLLRLGRISGQEYAGVLQDILRDPASSRDLKVRAMIDRNGARLGAILDGVRAAEQNGLPGATSEEKFAALGRSYGLSAADLEKTLLSVASNDADADVRAVAMSVLHALNRDNVEERNTMLQDCQRKWQEASGKQPGSYASQFIASLKGDLTAEADPLDGDAEQVSARKFLAAAALANLKGDGYSQQELNRALVETVSQTNPDAAMQALDLLVPDRIKDLSADDATTLRAEVLSLLTQPTSASNAATKVALTEMLPAIFQGAGQEQKQTVARYLESLLNPTDLSFAGSHPDLRKASVEALAAMGSRGSVAAIRERLSAENEPSAAVRLAALEALENLKTPGLRRAAMELLDRETDPAVASRMRSIELTGEELAPDSLDYKEAYDKTKEDLIKATTRSLASSQQWIKDNYPLLDGETFRAESNKAAQEIYGHFGGNAHYWWDAAWNWDSDIDEKKWTAAREEIAKRARGQMSDLVKAAQGTGSGAEEARKALTYLVLSNGRGFLDADRNWAVSEAAYGLYQLCQPGTTGRDQIAWAVETSLMNQPKMDRAARTTLVNALSWLVYREPATVSRAEAGSVLAAALELEYKAMPQQGEPGFDASKALQLKMLEAIDGYGNPRVTPVLEAMAEEHPMPEVKEAARKLHEKFERALRPAGSDAPPPDPETAARAQAAQTLSQRPDLTTRQYKQEFEQAKADLIKSTSRSTEKSQEWIGSNYPLLVGENFRRESKARADAVYGHLGGTASYLWDALTEWDSDIDEKKWKAAREEVAKETRGQFDSMIEQAKGNGSGADEARKALVDIIHTNGRPFLEADRDWAVNKAAMALYELCKPGATGRDHVVWAIETTLMTQPQISRSARLTLVYGLSWLAETNPPAITRAEAATVAAAALQAEIRSMPNRGESGYEDSQKIQLELLRQIKAHNHKKIYPVLEAAIAGHPMAEVKRTAEDMLATMRDGVASLRHSTTPDTVSSLDDRATRMGEALRTKDIDATCQAIFDACHQMPIRSHDDPRAAVLHQALQDSSEKVRLSAAWILLESSREADLAAAMDVLAALSVSGSRAGYRKDAQSLVDGIKKWGPTWSQAITRKVEAARARATAPTR